MSHIYIKVEAHSYSQLKHPHYYSSINVSQTKVNTVQ